MSFVEMAAVSEDGNITGAIPRKLGEVLKGSYTYFAEDDIIIAKITPCMENGKCALARGLSNKIGMGSSEFHVIRADKGKVLPAFVFGFLNRAEVRKIAEKNMTGSSGHRRVPEPFYADLMIPVPPLKVQAQIVTELEIIECESEIARTTIDHSRINIEKLISDLNHDSNKLSLKKLSAICTMQAGKFVSASEISDLKEEGLYPCYGGNGLRGFTKTFTHEGTYPLIGRQGALCGNVNMAFGKFHATEHAVVVTPKPDIDVHWLYYQLKALNLNHYATGVAQPGLSVNNILAVATPVPPLAEQKEFVTTVESLEKQIAEAQDIIAAAPARKEAVMKKYL